MRSRIAHAGLLPLLAARLALATEYVTDMDIFTELAECVQDAVSMDIMSMTSSLCGAGVTSLQACVCSEKGYSTSLATQLSSEVLAYCTSTASDDVASALTMLAAYCNQASAITFAQPATTVTQFIDEVAQIDYLAPCAYSQLSFAVMGMASSLCPTDAARLATCVCSRNENSMAVSASINTMVSDACSAHTADVESAQAFYTAYCGLNNGTSDFPTASSPPGDMSYYVTDMPSFWSMPACAQEALSQAVFTQTYEYCPSGPQLLASCACVKPSMSAFVSSYITSIMSWSCSSATVREGASSALAVFAQYCAAARDETTVAGITTSIAQTAPFGLDATGSGAAPAGTTATGTPATATGAFNSSGSTNSANSTDANDSNDANDSTGDSGSNTGVIVGAAVGGVGGVLLLAAAAYFVWRHKRKNHAGASEFQQLDNLGVPGTAAGGKAELLGTSVTASPATVAPPFSSYPPSYPQGHPGHSQELYSPHAAAPGTIPGGYAELGMPAAHTPELNAFPGVAPAHTQAELYGTTHPGPGSPAPTTSVTPVSAAGLSFHSGPVPTTYSELDTERR